MPVKSSNKPKDTPAGKTQAQRFLEAAKAAQVDESGRKFRQAMGKLTLQKQARKAKG